MDKAGEALKIIAARDKLNSMRAGMWGLIQRLDREEQDRPALPNEA